MPKEKKVLSNKQKRQAKKFVTKIRRPRNGKLPSECFIWNKKEGTKWVWDEKTQMHHQIYNPRVTWKYKLWRKKKRQKKLQYDNQNWKRFGKSRGKYQPQ